MNNEESFEQFTNDFDDWICGICREGDSAYDGVRTMHECQHHEFHTACLERLLLTDRRCPICRRPANATPPVFTQEMSDSQESLDSTHQFLLRFRYLATHTLEVPDSQEIDDDDSQSSQNIRRDHARRLLSSPRRQVIPDDRNRLRPRVRSDSQTDERCVFCRNRIDGMHAAIAPCDHRMHYQCMIGDIFYNGVDRDNMCLFCPTCRR
jgi:hypothetical protein